MDCDRLKQENCYEQFAITFTWIFTPALNVGNNPKFQANKIVRRLITKGSIFKVRVD